MPHSPQLVLEFPHDPGFGRAELLPHRGQDEARAWLERTSEWPLRRLVLWGVAGRGKSHLLHAWAEARGGSVVTAAPVPGSWPDRALAIDGIDQAADEIALLHVMNAAAEAGLPLLLASRMAPARLPVRLPDLASRLRATTAVEIGAADDGFLQMFLARLLAARQLRLPEELQAFLLTQLPRTPAALREAVARLEAAAPGNRLSLTRPRLAAMLGLSDISATPSPPGQTPGYEP